MQDSSPPQPPGDVLGLTSSRGGWPHVLEPGTYTPRNINRKSKRTRKVLRYLAFYEKQHFQISVIGRRSARPLGRFAAAPPPCGPPAGTAGSPALYLPAPSGYRGKWDIPIMGMKRHWRLYQKSEQIPSRFHLKYRWGLSLLQGGIFNAMGRNCFSKNAFGYYPSFALRSAQNWGNLQGRSQK